MVPDDGATGQSISVELVWSPVRGQVQHRWLQVDEGCTLKQALMSCADWPELQPLLQVWHVGVWGRRVPASTVLRARDRIEIYRPLTVDPKEARRLRYRATGRRIVSRHRPLAGKTE